MSNAPHFTVLDLRGLTHLEKIQKLLNNAHALATESTKLGDDQSSVLDYIQLALEPVEEAIEKAESVDSSDLTQAEFARGAF